MACDACMHVCNIQLIVRLCDPRVATVVLMLVFDDGRMILVHDRLPKTALELLAGGRGAFWSRKAFI